MSEKKGTTVASVNVSTDVDYELQAILAATEMPKTPTLEFDIDGNIALVDEIKSLIPESIDSPEEKYELFYKVIQKSLRSILPKGDANKKARALIREEFNTFLIRGHRSQNGKSRGSDCRMAYQEDMKQAAEILIECVSSNLTAFDLYTKMVALNKSRGY